MEVSAPVLLMGFNRPDTMSVVFDRLREVQPTRLFLAVDGPRADRPGEVEKVEQCRDLAQQVDWDCEVQTLFQDENLGCGLGVSTAISWFLDQVKEGIILEDDIVPDPSFFGFCSELLDRYRVDDRVFAISGCNYVPADAQSDPSRPYRFSRVPHVWGWATWSRSWAQHRLDIRDWRKRFPLRRLWSDVGHSVPGAAYWVSTYELLARGEIDTWDGQLALAAMASGQLTATSNINLVQNIGFGSDATHTVVDRDELQPLGQAPQTLDDVPVVVDEKADAWTLEHHYQATWRGLGGQAARYLKTKIGRP